MKLLSFLPNTFTFLNLFFGCIAVVYGLNGDLNTLALFVLLGMFCDFFDGFFARLLNVKSKLGVQLDSFSDLITFGLSSSVVMFILLKNSSFINQSNPDSYFQILPYFSFLITVASSYRLAKFNLDHNDSHFKGLPTPANALFIVFLPFLFENKFLISYSNILDNAYFLLLITILFSYLLVCNLKMFSFKFKKLSFKENKLRFLFSILSMLLIVFFNMGALPIIITLYIFISFLRIKL